MQTNCRPSRGRKVFGIFASSPRHRYTPVDDCANISCSGKRRTHVSYPLFQLVRATEALLEIPIERIALAGT